MNPLKNRLKFNIAYFSFWVGYFVLARLFFLIFHFDQTSNLDLVTVAKIFLYGLKLDFSFAGYLSAIPFLIMCFSIWLPEKILSGSIKVISIFYMFFVNLLMFVDVNLYGYWGTRLDATPLIYLNTPKEMLASVSTLTLIGGVTVWIISSLLFCYLIFRLINKLSRFGGKGRIWHFSILVLMTGALIIVFRGGIQTIPINQSNVYFSKIMYANHASINFAWNFFQSVTHNGHDKENRFISTEILDPQGFIEAKNTRIRKEEFVVGYDSILNTNRPNIIFVIWESLTAKAVESLGGVKGVTPNLNSLINEGLLFTNFYANGNRSDKGLVSIFSGYYPQPDKSIIKMPNKARSLPMLTKELKNLGYKTAFYYGGDTNFGNMNTYFMNGEVDDIIDGRIFDSDDWNSKWGVHDHVLFEKFSEDLNGVQEEPFFRTIFTLSSHEPFEFPGEYQFGKKTEEFKFLSSLAYTDNSLGLFIEEAKKQPWWDNTLIVILADHGHPLPEVEGPFNTPSRFHIPMLWLGGALANTNEKISTFSSQIDLAHTLLDLFKADNSKFEWGNNIFRKSESHYAHYIFNKGFGTIDANGNYLFDYVSRKSEMEKGKTAPELQKLGKSITQMAYQDFLER